MTTEYTLRIIKASNGWVVSSYDINNPGSYALDTMVVQDDNDLAGTIAAALVSQKLEGTSNKKAAPYKSPGLTSRGPAKHTTIDSLLEEITR